jgi:hypothetical protein
MTVYTDTRYPGTRFVEATTTLNKPANTIALYPEGGGPVYHLPLEAFKKHFVEAPKPTWRKAYFCLADGPLQVPGWTDGRRWNGWAIPHFERHVAEMLAKELTCGEFKFHWEGDNLICTDESYPDEPYGYLPDTIEGKQLWQVGDGWTWDTVETQE